MIDVIAFDGDDTLWHNETLFSVTQTRFREMMQRYVAGAAVDERLFATEMRNLELFGYGIKGFVLSMIETAIEITEGQVAASDIQALIDAGKWMAQHPVELLEGVRPTLEELAPTYRLMLITKGDLFDQESKVARSELGDLFWRVEVVSDKRPANYRRVLAHAGIEPSDFIMVGNSLKSDILPVVEIGGQGVYIPYHVTWAHEIVDGDIAGHECIHQLASIDELPGLVRGLASPAKRSISAS